MNRSDDWDAGYARAIEDAMAKCDEVGGQASTHLFRLQASEIKERIRALKPVPQTSECSCFASDMRGKSPCPVHGNLPGCTCDYDMGCLDRDPKCPVHGKDAEQWCAYCEGKRWICDYRGIPLERCPSCHATGGKE